MSGHIALLWLPRLKLLVYLDWLCPHSSNQVLHWNSNKPSTFCSDSTVFFIVLLGNQISLIKIVPVVPIGCDKKELGLTGGISLYFWLELLIKNWINFFDSWCWKSAVAAACCSFRTSDSEYTLNRWTPIKNHWETVFFASQVTQLITKSRSWRFWRVLCY